jgi:restriction system protein
MAEITRRRQGEMLQGILAILRDVPDGVPAQEALSRLEKRLSLSPYEQGTYKSGGRRFEKIARFSTLGAVKAGWMLKQKGQWILTDEGRVALTAFPDPEALFRRSDALYKTWRQSQPDDQADYQDGDVEEAGDAATVKLEEAIESAWGEVEQFIRAMNPYDFQDLVGALLRALGYFVVWTAPAGKDGGVDIVAAPDPLGTRSPRIKVQVKRQQQAVAVDGLRSFMATLGNDDVGLFVSTGGFTKDAREEARQQSTRKVTLIDLERLYDLWVEHSPKLPDEDRRRLPLRPVWFLAVE